MDSSTAARRTPLWMFPQAHYAARDKYLRAGRSLAGHDDDELKALWSSTEYEHEIRAEWALRKKTAAAEAERGKTHSAQAARRPAAHAAVPTRAQIEENTKAVATTLATAFKRHFAATPSRSSTCSRSIGPTRRRSPPARRPPWGSPWRRSVSSRRGSRRSRRGRSCNIADHGTGSKPIPRRR